MRTGSTPAAGVEPALALRLVGLAPQQGDADHGDRDRPEHRAAAEDRLDGEAPRRCRCTPSTMTGPASLRRRRTPGRRPPRVALSSPGAACLEAGSGRQQHPERGVQDEAEPARAPSRRRTPSRTHSTGHAQVGGEAGRHAADDLGRGGRGSRAGGARAGAPLGMVVIALPSSHSARGPPHEVRPRSDPETDARSAARRTRGRPRWCAGLASTRLEAMSTLPPDGHPTPTPDRPRRPGPRVSRDDVRDLARLRRSRGDRKIAGVGAGLARHLDVDPLITRVVLVVLVFFGGAGVLLYAAVWLSCRSRDRRGRRSASTTAAAPSRSPWSVRCSGLALVGDTLGGWGLPWPVFAAAAVVLVVLMVRGGEPRLHPFEKQSWVTPPPTGQPVRRPVEVAGRRSGLGVGAAGEPAGPTEPTPGAGAVLVRPGRHRPGLRRARHRRHRGRRRARLGLPRRGARHLRGAAGARRVLGPRRRAHPARPGRRAGDRRGDRRRRGRGRPHRRLPHDARRRCRTATTWRSARSTSTSPTSADLDDARRAHGSRSSSTSPAGSRSACPRASTSTSTHHDRGGRRPRLRRPPRRRRAAHPRRRRRRRPRAHARRPAGLRRDRDRPGGTMTHREHHPDHHPDHHRRRHGSRSSGRHPVDIAHLVMGVAFAGMTVVWALVASGAVVRRRHPLAAAGAVGARRGRRARRPDRLRPPPGRSAAAGLGRRQGRRTADGRASRVRTSVGA